MPAKMIKDRSGTWHRGPYEMPEQRPLMDHQERGIAWMAGRRNLLHAGEPGVGKTAQIIGAINALPAGARVLILCPCGLRRNWLRELALWLTTPRQCRIARRYIPDSEIVIVHYDALPKFEMQLRAITWAMIAMDEAHALKNPRSFRARQVLGDAWTTRLTAERKILATATPILNRPAELWPLLAILGVRMTEQEFAKRFCSKKDRNACTDPEGLRRLLEPIMLRQTKAECLKLPPKVRRIIAIDANAETLGAQDVKTSWEKECDKAGKFAGKVKMQKLVELRQRAALAKVRLPAVREHLWKAVAEDQKIVIVAHHAAVVDEIAGLFAAGSAVSFTGRESVQAKDEAIRRFQNEKGCCVFILSLSVAVGITLVAARRMIFLERLWTPALCEQGEDRIHRIGQTRPVLIEHIVIRNSIEARQLAVELKKQGMIDKVFGEEERPANKIAAGLAKGRAFIRTALNYFS